MDEKQKKIIYWYLKEKLDKLEAGCRDCDDIDCNGNYIYTLLKKEHQISMIDKKHCKKQMKEQAKELKKILYSPFFKKQRLNQCHHCKKLVERDSLIWGNVSRHYTGSVQVDYFCKDCVKKFKTLVSRK